MTLPDDPIITALAAREHLPTVYAVIVEFHCGYQQALRCLEMARFLRPAKISYNLDEF